VCSRASEKGAQREHRTRFQRDLALGRPEIDTRYITLKKLWNSSAYYPHHTTFFLDNTHFGQNISSIGKIAPIKESAKNCNRLLILIQLWKCALPFTSDKGTTKLKLVFHRWIKSYCFNVNYRIWASTEE